MYDEILQDDFPLSSWLLRSYKNLCTKIRKLLQDIKRALYEHLAGELDLYLYVFSHLSVFTISPLQNYKFVNKMKW